MAMLDGSSADISDPSYEDLFHLAALRTWSAAHDRLDALPKPFPIAQTTYGNRFTPEDRLEYGNLESEDERMSYTLSRFSERGLPAACALTISDLLSRRSDLQDWPAILPKLKTQMEVSKTNAMQKMQQASCGQKQTKRDFIAVPVDVKTDKRGPKIAQNLWKRALTELSIQLDEGKDAHIPHFIEIHAYLRDPIGGLSRSFEKQACLFRALLHAVDTLQNRIPFLMGERRHAIAQAAQESALLAAPYLNHVVHIHFHGQQKLSYVYVPLENLGRSEFSKPKHVLRIIQEILLSTPEGGLCPIVPVTIATYPNAVTRKASEELTIIIDGNHRVTAVMMLRMLAWKPKAAGREVDAMAALQQYCKKNELGAKWRVDLQEVLEEMFSPGGKLCLDLIHSMRQLVRRFEEVHDIPALVVQEESFHTVSTQRTLSSDEKPKLLHPWHQALFNDDSLGFAFPNAGQVHGRTAGFKALTLIPFTRVHNRLWDHKVEACEHVIVRASLIRSSELCERPAPDDSSNSFVEFSG